MNQITEVEQDTHWCFNGPSKRSGFSDSDQPMCISTNQELMLVALGPVDYHLNKGARLSITVEEYLYTHSRWCISPCGRSPQIFFLFFFRRTCIY